MVILTSLAYCKILFGHPHDITTQLLSYLFISRQLLVHFVTNIFFFFFTVLSIHLSGCRYRLKISLSDVNCNILSGHPHNITKHKFDYYFMDDFNFDLSLRLLHDPRAR